MKTEVNEVTINGIEYVKKGEEGQLAQQLDGMQDV